MKINELFQKALFYLDAKNDDSLDDAAALLVYNEGVRELLTRFMAWGKQGFLKSREMKSLETLPDDFLGVYAVRDLEDESEFVYDPQLRSGNSYKIGERGDLVVSGGRWARLWYYFQPPEENDVNAGVPSEVAKFSKLVALFLAKEMALKNNLQERLGLLQAAILEEEQKFFRTSEKTLESGRVRKIRC